MDKFKIGDVIEGIEDNRWCVGTIICIRGADGSYGLDVSQTDELSGCDLPLHKLDGNLNSPRGWFIKPKNAKLHKNYIIKQIIDDL